MLEYVIVWWDVVRIIHATRYICQVTSFSSIALLLPCTSRRFFSYSYPRSLRRSRSPCLPHPLISKVLPDLASFSRPRPSRPLFHTHHHHQHPPIRHLIATYIVARNVESYSVSLDSLKQVLMSCTPIPRSSPTAYPLATEHSSSTLRATFHEPFASARFVRSSLSIYLSLHFPFPLSHSLLSLPHSLSVPLFREPPSSLKNRQVRYYRRHITNAELVVIDWMPGTWICQLMWQTNPFRSSFSPRSLRTALRFCVCRISSVSGA